MPYDEIAEYPAIPPGGRTKFLSTHEPLVLWNFIIPPKVYFCTFRPWASTQKNGWEGTFFISTIHIYTIYSSRKKRSCAATLFGARPPLTHDGTFFARVSTRSPPAPQHSTRRGAPPRWPRPSVRYANPQPPPPSALGQGIFRVYSYRNQNAPSRGGRTSNSAFVSDYHRDLSPNSTDSKSVLRHARAVAHHPSNAMLSNAMRALLLAFALITIGNPNAHLLPTWTLVIQICRCHETIAVDETWISSNVYKLHAQVFVQANATLTIEAGTKIEATKPTGTQKAPAVIIERGAKIIAKGTASKPITFTSAEASAFDYDNLGDTAIADLQGLWGGLIILGKAPIAGSNPCNANYNYTDTGTYNSADIEGLPSGATSKYGGCEPEDNSGVLSYVKVWHGGSDLGGAAGSNSGNEINGITLGGVVSGTTIDHIEVAYNLDDGVEFFGGTVNAKYVSVLFCGDDGVDTDQALRQASVRVHHARIQQQPRHGDGQQAQRQ